MNRVSTKISLQHNTALGCSPPGGVVRKNAYCLCPICVYALFGRLIGAIAPLLQQTATRENDSSGCLRISDTSATLLVRESLSRAAPFPDFEVLKGLVMVVMSIVVVMVVIAVVVAMGMSQTRIYGQSLLR